MIPKYPSYTARLHEGHKGLVVGIANEQSIAWGCAAAFRGLGAEVAITYRNEKTKKYVEPLAREPVAEHAIGWLTSTVALPLFYFAVREHYRDTRRATLATWMLALYYVHIWMAGTAFVETPYVCLLFATMLFAARAVRREGGARDRAAFAAGAWRGNA